MNSPILVLASNSPRRRELLGLGGWMFHVRPAEVDESPRRGEAPGAYVLRLAESKARACASDVLSTGAASAHADQTVVAADTTVAIGSRILGKPRDMAEATEMLRRLRGRTHQVHTGIGVLRVSDGVYLSDLCTTDVPMRPYSDEEIDRYVASGDPLDKAGAYAIQHAGFHPVEALAGCFASVMGLPLCHLTRLLRRLDIPPKTDIAAECQAALQYGCPVYAGILGKEEH